ncbi:hypothetical protein [Streptomyces sp. VB1]|uniref:hypothetical protein n=1 Tax=Streptomyces sp. VB1 TaxID=2986803 RepID=UPI0022420840|nr:hypothetical protein [Streptomyces sp. VB1]UZI34029.1 hypothetical protein OH133_38560 [Streptomyces sp. VB1]
MTDHMPLSVPLLLTPGYPDRFYTVHLHRVRWIVGAVSRTLTADRLAELGANAQRGLRMVSACIAAELTDADVEVTENPDGSAEAVARVLCTENVCAAVAEQYRRDADEDVEAETARAWAATQLQDHTVELLKVRDEVEKTVPDRTVTAAQMMLIGVLAAQQERTGGSTDRVVLMLDEAAFLARESGLLTDGTPEGAREQIARLIRQGRKPDPVDVDSASDAVTWVAPARGSMTLTLSAESRAHLDLPNAFHMAPEHLVRETETLARSVAAGQSHNVGVKRLAELCGELARRHGAEPQPRPCPGGCTEDDDPAHDLVHRIGHRPRAVRAGEVRTAGIILAPERQMRALPAALPNDDATFVLVYRADIPGLALVDAIRAGDDEAARDAVTGALRWLTADGK